MLLHARSLALTALIALGLIMSGQAIASANGASTATGYMVLCTGHGAVVVFTDEDGQPTAPPHLCPDCTLSALMAVLGPDAAPVPLSGGVSKADLPHPARQVAWQAPRTAQARAPPSSV